MKKSWIGKPVEIPAIGYRGIVSAYDPHNSTFIVDTEFGWINNVRSTDMIDLSEPKRAPEENYKCGFSSVG